LNPQKRNVSLNPFFPYFFDLESSAGVSPLQKSRRDSFFFSSSLKAFCNPTRFSLALYPLPHPGRPAIRDFPLIFFQYRFLLTPPLLEYSGFLPPQELPLPLFESFQLLQSFNVFFLWFRDTTPSSSPRLLFPSSPQIFFFSPDPLMKIFLSLVVAFLSFLPFREFFLNPSNRRQSPP